MSSNLTPGFLAIHSNRMEYLRDTVFDWLRTNPLLPLEQETFLVQSNGVAEWLKVSMAEQMGICSGIHVTLPARFLWDAYRNILGSTQVPRDSAYDRQPLTWRLMQLLPGLLEQPVFSPLKYFLKDGSPERRLQLAQRLADLFDQYQVYRANWLQAWASGQDVLINSNGQTVLLEPGQRWQAQLWRAVRESVAQEVRQGGRADVHRQFIDALNAKEVPTQRLPRRVVLFGVASIPYQTLEALGALAGHIQVVVAVPNPCQHYWGDIISGRELLKAHRRRQKDCPRTGDLAGIPFEQLHAHCHPLLTGWGRLGRDFIRMLDEFDDISATQQNFPNLRVDVFSDDEAPFLLSQVQASIREMLPLPQEPAERPVYDPSDVSIRFHVTHSIQREVEVLHDQLLDMFASSLTDETGHPTEAGRLRPRDVIVMVPDIDKFSPSIRAVFDQYPRSDHRHIPFEIADVSERRINPTLVALEWLLRLPQQRCLQSEVRDLLDIPAIAARFGIAQQDLPRVAQWIEASGIRWGLDHAHRQGLELGPAGEQNAWIFGIRRMLLGYASGAQGHYAGIEPFSQVGGLDAALAGSLAQFVDSLVTWRRELSHTRPPMEWGEVALKLVHAFFKVSDQQDQLVEAQLTLSLQHWLEDCTAAGFAEPVPADILREAWLGPIDDKTLHQRFISGGVTFCTLMPMRAIPYRVVCLLGMSEGDFPRRAHRADFDLLASPGMACPGDRSRREDDRYLMLEALLSARDRLYISWVGKSARDNSDQPPSVLVAQLRDYLKAGWRNLDLSQLTTEHFLQPFSRHYFEEGNPATHAFEWRMAHEGTDQPAAPILPAYEPAAATPLRIADLESFMKQPVKQFFARRLHIQFRQDPLAGMDDEPFALDKLEVYQICALLLSDDGPQETPDQVQSRMREKMERLIREGRLPIGHLAKKLQEDLIEEVGDARAAWLFMSHRFPRATEKIPLSLRHADVAIEDWLDQVRKDGLSDIWLNLSASRLLKTRASTPKIENLRPEKLIGAYVRQLLLSAQGKDMEGYVVARDCILQLGAMKHAQAQTRLEALLQLWRQGMSAPLQTACKTALTLLAKGDRSAASTYDGPAFETEGMIAEKSDPCLSRLWPDYVALAAEPQHLDVSEQLYRPLLEWIAADVQVFPLQHDFAEAVAA